MVPPGDCFMEAPPSENHENEDRGDGAPAAGLLRGKPYCGMD